MKKAEEVWKASGDDFKAKIRRKEDASLLTKYEVLQEQKTKKDEEAFDTKTDLEKVQKIELRRLHLMLLGSWMLKRNKFRRLLLSKMRKNKYSC